MGGCTMPFHEKIDYIELPAISIPACKSFFEDVFGWQFEDYGPEYSAFYNAGIKGGFFQSEMSTNQETGSALIVFYSADLDKTREKIIQSGGIVTRPIFSFPGGRRFHFVDPSGNEFAVWSDRKDD